MAFVFAKQLALIAFATGTLQGVLSGGSAEAVLQRTLLTSLLFYVLGVILGELARWVVEDNVRSELSRIQNQAGNTAIPSR
ncbi:MAG: hypothetical protein U0903_10570 [Planctomycetales bacterium]